MRRRMENRREHIFIPFWSEATKKIESKRIWKLSLGIMTINSENVFLVSFFSGLTPKKKQVPFGNDTCFAIN